MPSDTTQHEPIEWVACPHMVAIAKERGFDEPWGDPQGLIIQLAPALQLSLCGQCLAVAKGKLLETMFRDAIRDPIQTAVQRMLRNA